MRHAERGITLIELMMVVVIVAILASIGVPSYRSYIIRTQRTEAKSALLQLQAAQEKFYLQNNAYTDDVTTAPPTGLGLPGTTENGLYTIVIATPPGQTFRATATPVSGGGQDDDAKCTQFAIDNNGTREATGSGGVATCWH